jgi:two-component system OmpR family response regulator
MRILIVEDEVTLAQALRRGLNIAGYSVDVAHDGNEALFQARVHDYDAIVLDLMLPEVDGLSVCETLRKEGRWMPVLMLTARDGVGDTVRGLDVGADDYLVKPFDFSELLARLRALVRRGASERPPVMQIGDLTIDPARRTVERAGRSIDLTPREFALVEYLARHSGQVVSRTRLLEHVGTASTTAFRTSSTSTSPTCVARSTHRSTSGCCARSGASATSSRSRAEDLDPHAADRVVPDAARGDARRRGGVRVDQSARGPARPS